MTSASANGPMRPLRPLRPLWALWACAAFGGCEGLDVGAGAAFIESRLQGTVALVGSGGGSLDDQQIDLDEVGVEDPSASLLVFAEAKVDRWRGRFNAFRFADNGTGALSEPFGNLAAGTAVDASFAFENAKVSATYDLLDLDYFRLGAGVAADYIDAQIDIAAQTVASRETVHSTVIVPMPLLRAELQEGMVIAFAELGAMGGDFGDGQAVWVDLETGLRVRPWPALELFGGYRWIRNDGDGVVGNQAYAADLEVAAWFVGAAVHFGGGPAERTMH